MIGKPEGLHCVWSHHKFGNMLSFKCKTKSCGVSFGSVATFEHSASSCNGSPLKRASTSSSAEDFEKFCHACRVRRQFGGKRRANDLAYLTKECLRSKTGQSVSRKFAVRSNNRSKKLTLSCKEGALTRGTLRHFFSVPEQQRVERSFLHPSPLRLYHLGGQQLAPSAAFLNFTYPGLI